MRNVRIPYILIKSNFVSTGYSVVVRNVGEMRAAPWKEIRRFGLMTSWQSKGPTMSWGESNTA